MLNVWDWVHFLARFVFMLPDWFLRIGRKMGAPFPVKDDTGTCLHSYWFAERSMKPQAIRARWNNWPGDRHSDLGWKQ